MAFFHHWDVPDQKRIPALNFREGINFYRPRHPVATLIFCCISLNTGIWRLFDVFWKTAYFFTKNPEKLTPEALKKYTGLAGRNLDAVFDRHGPMVTKRASDQVFGSRVIF